jgi:hypothetical protein
LTASQSNIEKTPEAALPDLERRVLCALCGEDGAIEGRQMARQRLEDYHWREAVHQAIFEVIMNFAAASSRALREQLPARLTRRGFPDFDFESVFQSQALTPGELEELIRKLLAMA